MILFWATMTVWMNTMKILIVTVMRVTIRLISAVMYIAGHRPCQKSDVRTTVPMLMRQAKPSER